jgi:hypothetical protein
LGVFLPSDCRRSDISVKVRRRGYGEYAEAALPLIVVGKVEVAPAEDAESGGGGRIQRTEVGEEVTEWPAWVGRIGRGIYKCDGLLI